MEILIGDTKLKCHEDGTIERFHTHSNKWKICHGSKDTTGYLQIGINSNHIEKKHRLIAHAFGLIDLNSNLIVDHIDRNILNNQIKNLRAITSQQNSFNTDAKGCWFSQRHKKWEAYIYLNGKKHVLGYFKTEEEAHQKYLEAKEIFHIV